MDLVFCFTNCLVDRKVSVRLFRLVLGLYKLLMSRPISKSDFHFVNIIKVMKVVAVRNKTTAKILYFAFCLTNYV